MRKIRMTTAQALVKFLNAQFVEFDGKQHRFVKGIFTIFGHGNVLGLGEALAVDPGHLEVFQGRNEQGMANAAMAFAKQKHRKQIIACTSSVGPGAANMLTSAATATANNIPLLLLPGDVFATRQPDPVLQQIEQTYDLSISTNDAFRPVSKYWDRVSRPEQLMTALLNGMRVLTDPANTGAVTISLPQDVQSEAWDFPEKFFEKRVHRIERRIPSTESIKEAAALIKTKRKPLLILGGGVRYSEAADAFLKFAESFNIPFCETQAGKSGIESDHHLNLGGVGVTGNSAANTIAKQADLIIGVGTRFTDFTTSSKQLFTHADMLNINISEFDAGKMDAVMIIGDAKVGLETLHKELLEYKSNFSDEIMEEKKKWNNELDRLGEIIYGEAFTPEIEGHFTDELKEYQNTLDTELTQTTVIKKINDLIDDNAIIVGAAGSLPGDLQRMWESKQRNTYHMEYGYSCMGYEIAGALGVKLAEPENEVYAMVGDGSYLMLHTELVTSLQEGKKINILLFDNSGFGCINNLQMGSGIDSFCTEFRKRRPETGKLDGAIMKINYAKVAEGYGAITYSVNTMEELEMAITDSKKQMVSTLIDIKVLPKTMTKGYEAWWHVGIPEVSSIDGVRQAFVDKESNLEKARKY